MVWVCCFWCYYVLLHMICRVVFMLLYFFVCVGVRFDGTFGEQLGVVCCEGFRVVIYDWMLLFGLEGVDWVPRRVFSCCEIEQLFLLFIVLWMY